MGFQALRGTTDVFGDEVKQWSTVEHTARRIARLYGYREIRTPLIEDAALFLRSVGETSDIVQKEMFRFEDRGGHEIALRPEGTASVVRAYLEHHLDKTEGFAKLFYLGPMFRAERPQAGRFRQFHQYGVEAIGSQSPWVDVEVIVLCVHILQACGVRDAMVWFSSMGCRKDQERSATKLRERLKPQFSTLCKECQARFEKNVFRVLDCKHPTCHQIAWSIEGSPFLLCEDCAQHFNEVRRGLKEAEITFDDTKVFARGLDYYTRTVFEVRAKGLGAQDAIAAGGRYDHLVEELGGPSMGAIGFAAGIERVLMVAGSPKSTEAWPQRRGMYLAITQPELTTEGFRLIQQLREHGVPAMMGYDQKSLKAQLREADQAGCQFVAILGQRELQERMISLRELGPRSCSRDLGKSERTVPLDAFVDEMARTLKSSDPSSSPC
ncbi:MAG: histidine--tRNA ligase [Candidatus Omnitrophica bacterium]|nr:histidine--tRNA ligase [Candidatus Omnitrophota bacterium]